jgi:DNA-binding MarR family transcriptional regulator
MVHTIQTLFLISAPIAAVAFALSWLLPDIELRKTLPSHGPVEPSDSRAPFPDLQHAVERLAHRENRRELYSTLAERGGLRLDPRPCWLLFRLADHPDCTIGTLSSRLQIDLLEIERLITALRDAGLIEMPQRLGQCEFSLTKDGQQAAKRLLTIRRAAFTQMLAGRDPDAHPEIGQMIRQLAHELHADDAKLLADASSFRGSSL